MKRILIGLLVIWSFSLLAGDIGSKSFSLRGEYVYTSEIENAEDVDLNPTNVKEKVTVNNAFKTLLLRYKVGNRIRGSE